MKQNLIDTLKAFQEKLTSFDANTVDTWSIHGLVNQLDELICLTEDELEDSGPEFDSAGFTASDRMQEEEDSHHCDDLSCNCSI